MRSVEIQEHVHAGGTKDYILVTLIDAEGTSTLMRRNGSRNARGQMQRASAGSIGHVTAERDKEARLRAKKDYAVHYQKVFTSAKSFKDEYRGSVCKWAEPGSRIYDEVVSFLQGQAEEAPVETKLSEEDLEAIEAERDSMSEVW